MGSTWRYIGALAAVASVAVALLLLLEQPPAPSVTLLIVLTLAVAVAERTEVLFTWGRTRAGFTLVEVVLTAGFLLAPASHVVLAVVPGVVLAHLSLFRQPIKLAFNLASVALGAAVAGSTVVLAPVVGPTIEGRAVLAVLGGMLLYGALSLTVFAGLLRRLPGAKAASSLLAQLPLATASTAGTAAVGIVVAAVWVAQPELLPFVLAPAIAVHLATRASVRAAELLEVTRTDHDRLSRVIDGASDGILLLDAEGTVEVWNPAMSALTGVATSDAVGRPVEVVLPGSVRRNTTGGGAWVAQEDGPVLPHTESLTQLRASDGTVRDVRERHARTFDERGTCNGEVVVFRDVSREQELARLRSDFVARVSHELRTPLTPIRGFADVLLRRGDQLSAADRDDALHRIVDRTDHLQALVEDLLLVTRMEHGGQLGAPDDLAAADPIVHPRPTDLGPVIADVMRAVADRHRARDIQVRGRVTAGPVTVLADPARTHQILGVLLDNAVRYTAVGTPVEVVVDADDRQVVVRVIDRGPGIPPAERERIFERFHRLEDPDTMRTGGVGLGLFIARRLAEAMGGDLRLVAAEVGDGATFELRLPVPRGGTSAVAS